MKISREDLNSLGVVVAIIMALMSLLSYNIGVSLAVLKFQIDKIELQSDRRFSHRIESTLFISNYGDKPINIEGLLGGGSMPNQSCGFVVDNAQAEYGSDGIFGQSFSLPAGQAIYRDLVFGIGVPEQIGQDEFIEVCLNLLVRGHDGVLQSMSIPIGQIKNSEGRERMAVTRIKISVPYDIVERKRCASLPMQDICI